MALDQATVWADFNNTPAPEEVRRVLRPHIIGGQAELHRYSVASEKTGINVGPYLNTVNTTYPWPSKITTGPVDLNFAAVFIDNALLNYFTDPEGGGSGTITAVPSFTNRIVTSAPNGFKTNGAFIRDPLLFDRDVQIGDVVHLKYLTDELYTTVRNLIGDVIPATVADATTDAANPNTQVFNDTQSQTGGIVNDITVTEDGTLYDGLPSGFINETYIVTVIQGSTGGDATTALVRVDSGSGLDNQASLAPAAFGVAFNIGTRGMKMTFNHVADDLQVGQQWTLTVQQAFTKPVPTSGGTYTGTEDQIYIIEVTKGQTYAADGDPQITVISNIGVDSSGPTNVPAAATNVPVGTHGVVVQFSGSALRKGDKYYIQVTAESVGAYRTIELNNSMPAGLLAAPDMLLELSIQKNITVPDERASSPSVFNWTADQNGLTLNAGIDAYDSTWTSGGVELPIAVKSGPDTAVFIQYRAWTDTWFNRVGSVNLPEQVEGLLGPVTPDNPLAYAVYKATQNSNRMAINFTGIGDPDDPDQWKSMLRLLKGLPIYSIVPLTVDPDILDLVKQHIIDNSADPLGTWRVGWFNLVATESIAIVDSTTTTDMAVALATVGDNPSMTGTQYTYVTNTNNNAQFVTKGVRPGDIFRYLFSVDAWGNPTYQSFTIAQVVNEQTLILALPGLGAAVAIPQRFEIWRNLTKDEMAERMADQCMAINNKRIRYLWPDKADTIDGTVEGFHLCAAYAGFTAGIFPHQGMKGIPITGFTGVSRSTSFFGNGQLNILRDGGAFTVSSDSNGNVFARDVNTTQLTPLSAKLEVVNRNDDAIRHVFYNRIAEFFGVSNLTDAALTIIRTELESAIVALRSQTFIDRLGAMLTDAEIVEIRPDLVVPDQVDVIMNVVRPFSIDNLLLIINFSPE
jgi:hypothetical protein